MNKNKHTGIGKKTALYCRLAAEDPDGMDAQKRFLAARAADRGMNDCVFYCDNGASGLDYDRPAFSKLNADIDAGLIGAVVVRDISRVGRNISAAIWIDGLASRGVSFVSAAEEPAEPAACPFPVLLSDRRVSAARPKTARKTKMPPNLAV
jgi:DNA invertase Pin-like site-specific DNA recombinase